VSLLDDALQASGGLDRWRRMRRFTLHMSISGPLCSARCATARLKELAVNGNTQVQALEITGFAQAHLRALYRPGWVALEGQDARCLIERRGVPAEFHQALQSTSWDELHLAHYCGCLVWNHIVTPFILADPDFQTMEVRSSLARGDGLRALRIVTPARVVTHASTQTLYFDREGFLRRRDYRAPHDDHTQVAQVYSGHQRFSGILVPTLCRLLSIGAKGVPIAKPSLVDFEIFDARFE